MIDEILEHRETYPENPSKALDLSNVKKRKLFHPSVLHEEHGNVYNAIDKSQFHSFPRVSSINSTKNIDLLCAALLWFELFEIFDKFEIFLEKCLLDVILYVIIVTWNIYIYMYHKHS